MKSNFSEEQARQLLASEEGRELMRLLSQDGGRQLRQAAAAFQSGDTAGAQAALAPILSTPEAAALLQKLNGK